MTSHATSPDVSDVPDVTAFVAEVREHLADLTPEERDELVDGLEADLSEQVGEGATGLTDPAAYAAELRAAAGIPAARKRGWPRLGWPVPEGGLNGDLDRVRDAWFGAVESRPETRAAWSVLAALRPVWWVTRAWLAVTLLDRLAGPPEAISPLPTLRVSGLGLLLLLAAVALSVLVGQGRLWSGRPGRRPLPARVVLLGLNLLAIILVPSFVGSVVAPRASPDQFAPAAEPRSGSGLQVDGRRVHNLYPYDAQGRPLTGVQLVDGAGRPVTLPPAQAVSGRGADRVVGCPWFNGTTELFNVFPLRERAQRRRDCRAPAGDGIGPIAVPDPPLAQVPPVSPDTAQVP